MSEDFDLPNNVLQNMLNLIEEGNLSKEEVIEHLINNGFLPVAVTDLGKLPISIGLIDNKKEKLISTNQFREELSSEKLQEFVTTPRVPFDEKKMRKPTTVDPNFDFERIDPARIRSNIKEKTAFESRPMIKVISKQKSQRQEKPTITTESNKEVSDSTSFLKADKEEMEKIEAVMAMIRMFENDQISEDELLQMMAQMGDEIIGDDNPITEFTMFNALDMPVESTFFTMDRPQPTTQERPPVEENIIFPDQEPIIPVNDPLVNTESQKPSIKPFTSFGTKFRENHNQLPGISVVEENIVPPSGVAINTNAPPHPHRLYYNDLHNQEIDIKLPNNFPDFSNFNLKHEEYGPIVEHHNSYLPPSQEYPEPPSLHYDYQELPPSPHHYHSPPHDYSDYHQEQSPSPLKHHHKNTNPLSINYDYISPVPVHDQTQPPIRNQNTHDKYYSKHHYQQVYSEIPIEQSMPVKPAAPLHHQPYYKQYENVNERPLQFDEMTHEVFAPQDDGYNGPREPFGPPASLLPDLSPQHRELPTIEPRPPSYVKSLPDYPTYGHIGAAYNNEGYADYPNPAYNPDIYLPTYTPAPDTNHNEHKEQYHQDNYHHQYPPPQEYIPSTALHHPEPKHHLHQAEPSPLYLHHGPGGYDEPKHQPAPQEHYHVNQQHNVPVYLPKRQGYDPDPVYPPSQEYGSRGKKSIAPLPDHNTDKPFAYEDLPLPPLTGFREIDKTIENIHKAFVEGDTLEGLTIVQ